MGYRLWAVNQEYDYGVALSSEPIAQSSEPHHCAVRPASRTAFPQRATSPRMNAAYSDGVFVSGSSPADTYKALSSGLATAAAMSPANRLTMSFGVPVGTA